MSGILMAAGGGGGGAPTPELVNITLFARDSSTPYAAWAYFVVKPDGEIWYDEANNNLPSSDAYLQTWLNGGDPTLYSVRLTGTGTAPDFPLNTWYSLETYSRSWGWEIIGEDTATFNGTLEIALTSDTSTVLASCTVSVEVVGGLGI